MRRLRRAVLRWFDEHGRELPWRPSPGLYGTWVSEIMLQQTQVATVIPYYRRFLSRFPDVQALAAADEEEVLRYWEGLGYYRRARQLHAAARRVVSEHAGRIPHAMDDLLALPGIGRYTAGAILSIALDQRHPILEANTTRVLSRWLVLDTDPTQGESQRRLWALAEAVLPRRRCGDFNQALMELGSTLCTPRAPQCLVCPVASLCPAYAAGVQDCIPRNARKTTYVELQEAAVVIQRSNGQVLLRRCQPGERWAGLWDFPRFAIPGADGPATRKVLCGKVHALTGVTIRSLQKLATIRHGVTRFRITLTCYRAVCQRGRAGNEDMKWVPLGDLARYPLSVTGRRISRMLL
jgi:A/G-specific adenine glycosylase